MKSFLGLEGLRNPVGLVAFSTWIDRIVERATLPRDKLLLMSLLVSPPCKQASWMSPETRHSSSLETRTLLLSKTIHPASLEMMLMQARFRSRWITSEARDSLPVFLKILECFHEYFHFSDKRSFAKRLITSRFLPVCL